MKKKLKNITFDEMHNYCEHISCIYCPFCTSTPIDDDEYNVCDLTRNSYFSFFENLSKDVLNQELDFPNEEPTSLNGIKCLTANEATEKTAEAIEKCSTAELRDIMQKIYGEVNKGQYTVSYSGIISETAKRRLEELGYEVERGSQYNESYVVIKWPVKLR